jgi:hypothetical protein
VCLGGGGDWIKETANGTRGVRVKTSGRATSRLWNSEVLGVLEAGGDLVREGHRGTTWGGPQ